MLGKEAKNSASRCSGVEPKNSGMGKIALGTMYGDGASFIPYFFCTNLSVALLHIFGFDGSSLACRKKVAEPLKGGWKLS